MIGEWSVMFDGFVNFIHDDQGGRRGDDKTFAASMAMMMGQRPLGGGAMGLRAMLSLDPAFGKRGYPLLFQTGETADGRTPLIDRQHPHDFFMELAISYSVPLGDGRSMYAYAGLPGEPALGPPAFMHRFSGADIPEAPLTHYWLDSTHITFGVVTVGYAASVWKIEASAFNGREPDEHRWNIEMRRLDSGSLRLSFNPSANCALEISHGYLDSPEQLEPDVEVRRTTFSASYQRPLSNGDWQTTFAWGRNKKRGERLDGFLLESTFVLAKTHTFFGRIERVENNEFFEAGHRLHDRIFKVNKLSVGYIYDFARTGPARWGIGGLVSTYAIPGALESEYGSDPQSYMVSFRARLD